MVLLFTAITSAVLGLRLKNVTTLFGMGYVLAVPLLSHLAVLLVQFRAVLDALGSGMILRIVSLLLFARFGVGRIVLGRT